MSRPQYKSPIIQDFSGGWNTKWSLNATQLQENQSPYLKNIDYTARFAFTKRRGLEILGDATVGSGSIKSLYTFVKPDSSEILIRSFAQKLQYLDGSTWTDISGATSLTADLKFDFETFKGTVVASNGTDDFMSWTGSGAVTTYAGNPKATILASAFLRLWAAGVASDPALLYYSAPDDFTNFSSGGAGNTNFQYAISSLIPFFDSSGNELLQVFLVNGDMFHVGFDSSGTIYKRRVRRNVGSLNHRATKQTENTNFILDIAKQIRGIGYEQYVNDIRSNSKSVFIDSYLSTLTMTNACAAYFAKNYILSAQSPGAPANNVSIVFDENYSSWRLYDGFGANQYAVYGNKLAFASSTDLNVYRFNSELYGDNNIPIVSIYQTRDLDFDEALDKKTARFIKIQGLISPGCILKVKGYYDGQTYAPGFTKTILGSGDYVSTTPVSTLGSDELGAIPFAGLGGTSSSIALYPFSVTLSIPSTNWDSMRLEFRNEQNDVDFVIFHIKPYVDVLTGSRNDISSYI